jgi:hypothetical protein
MAASRGLALTATERMVDGVHGDTTGLGAYTLPPVAPGLADLDQLAISYCESPGLREMGYKKERDKARDEMISRMRRGGESEK